MYGVSNIPSQSGYVKNEKGPIYITINSSGFRGPDRSYEKQQGTYRIVVIGDSTIEAFNIQYEQTLTEVLEKDLRKAGLPVEVINLGISNFGTAQELLLLEKEGLRYQPDLVILAYCYNDPANNHPAIHGDTDRPYFHLDSGGHLVREPYEPKRRSRGALRDFLRKNLRIYTFFPRRIRELKHLIQNNFEGVRAETFPREYLQYVTPLNSDWAEAWELTRALIQEFRRESEEASARFLLMEIPYPEVVYPADWRALLNRYPKLQSEGQGLDRLQPHRLLTSFAQKEQIPFVSLLPAFLQAAEGGARLFDHKDIHWNAEGNSVASEKLKHLIRPYIEECTERGGGL